MQTEFWFAVDRDKASRDFPSKVKIIYGTPFLPTERADVEEESFRRFHVVGAFQ